MKKIFEIIKLDRGVYMELSCVRMSVPGVCVEVDGILAAAAYATAAVVASSLALHQDA